MAALCTSTAADRSISTPCCRLHALHDPRRVGSQGLSSRHGPRRRTAGAVSCRVVSCRRGSWLTWSPRRPTITQARSRLETRPEQCKPCMYSFRWTCDGPKSRGVQLAVPVNVAVTARRDETRRADRRLRRRRRTARPTRGEWRERRQVGERHAD
ncbi:hypothetical protein BC567DRAFT_92762 [Phyllosticta citribraziliensis]